ncbi:trans-aconitate 2-methyltransferase [Corallococcus interemptor]|uniref:Trans-aconitate 2-methyltransferase n=1 Tax=Corallococcus interemptor TaxID=2316720 RepID=A0A3A8Q7B9_9BACT|nr:trans-aconitate 2-methyltransferase [Corallococcus interemptor]RKH64028.1 trans-aconitate 2-methyltransferase [Corallococcus interemptor]
MDWSAAQYTRFEDERNRPIRDLLARIPTAEVKRAADLGCGPGNSTELLRARFPAAAVTGMDSSPDMLTAARKRLPDVRFDAGDIATWSDPGPYDVILANAVLQWVPDHATLLPALLHKLTPGGSLAVQMPDNLDEPSHRLMRDTASEGPWADKLKGAANARTERQDASWYYRVLREAGATVDLWRTTYFHPLTGGASAVVEWFKGSGLRPFLEPLDAGEKTDFLARYQSAIARAYPALPDGTVLLPFPRLFLIATRREIRSPPVSGAP